MVNLGSLIDMLENGEIDLKPEFQRASDLWSPIQKSRLIESILLGLPLPSFYFSEDPATKKYAIIDGLQRLCALKDFILEKEHPLHLTKLQFLEKKRGGRNNKVVYPPTTSPYRVLLLPEGKELNTLDLYSFLFRFSQINSV